MPTMYSCQFKTTQLAVYSASQVIVSVRMHAQGGAYMRVFAVTQTLYCPRGLRFLPAEA